jgi:hypothetical protein
MLMRSALFYDITRRCVVPKRRYTITTRRRVIYQQSADLTYQTRFHVQIVVNYDCLQMSRGAAFYVPSFGEMSYDLKRRSILFVFVSVRAILSSQPYNVVVTMIAYRCPVE